MEKMEKTEKKNKCLEILKTLVSNIWYLVLLIAVVAIIFLIVMNWGAVLSVIARFLTIIMPFIIGFFFACLINPLVKSIRRGLELIKRGKAMQVKRVLSVLISYLIVIGVITVLIIYIFPQVKESVSELGHTMKRGYFYMVTHEEEINDRIPFVDISGIIDYTKNFLYDKVVNHSSDLFPYVYQISSSVLGTTYNVLMGLVISIYLILDSRKLKKGLKRVMYSISPKGKEREIWETLRKCSHIFNGFLFGKVIDSLIIGLLCLIAMSILRLPYALLLSLIVCITNMIPYFGPFIGAIPGVLIYLFIDFKLAIIFAIMILVLQQFDGLYLGPKILGDQTGIKPLWVIFGITVGGAYFGVMGMFLGVPAVAVIMYLVNLFVTKKLKKKNITSLDTRSPDA